VRNVPEKLFIANKLDNLLLKNNRHPAQAGQQSVQH
jgi:hypothetical protein